MSAAEPASPPTTPTVNAGRDAAVINISGRRTRRSPVHPSGGWQTVDPTPIRPVPASSATSSEKAVRQAALRLVADDMERIFNSDGRSLTDPETAAVYVRTLAIVEHALKGSVQSGIISEEQRGELAVLIEGMKEAPRLA